MIEIQRQVKDKVFAVSAETPVNTFKRPESGQRLREQRAKKVKRKILGQMRKLFSTGKLKGRNSSVINKPVLNIEQYKKTGRTYCNRHNTIASTGQRKGGNSAVIDMPVLNIEQYKKNLAELTVTGIAP